MADDITLNVATTSNQTTPYKLSRVQKITFENGNVVVNMKNGEKASTAISEISRLFFGVAAGNVADVNGDGNVDTQDVLSIYDFMQNAGSTEGAVEDVNGDGNVDTQDVLVIYDYIQTH